MHWNAYHKTHSTVSNQINSRNKREHSYTHIVRRCATCVCLRACLCMSVQTNRMCLWTHHSLGKVERSTSASARERETHRKNERNLMQKYSLAAICLLQSVLSCRIQKIRENNKKSIDMRTEPFFVFRQSYSTSLFALTIEKSPFQVSLSLKHAHPNETLNMNTRIACHILRCWNSLGCGFFSTFNRQRKPTTHWTTTTKREEKTETTTTTVDSH